MSLFLERKSVGGYFVYPGHVSSSLSGSLALRGVPRPQSEGKGLGGLTTAPGVQAVHSDGWNLLRKWEGIKWLLLSDSVSTKLSHLVSKSFQCAMAQT